MSDKDICEAYGKLANRLKQTQQQLADSRKREAKLKEQIKHKKALLRTTLQSLDAALEVTEAVRELWANAHIYCSESTMRMIPVTEELINRAAEAGGDRE